MRGTGECKRLIRGGGVDKRFIRGEGVDKRGGVDKREVVYKRRRGG